MIKNAPVMRVRAGYENPSLGLYYGEQFLYVILCALDIFPDQVVVCELQSSRVIAGVNAKIFEPVPKSSRRS